MTAPQTDKDHDYNRNLEITYHPIGSLRPYEGNARIHSDKQIHQIGQSIIEFGFTNPILIDERRMILAGHGRVLAAESLGISKVPTAMLSDMTEAQKRTYILTDNKLADNAGWDTDILAIEFQALDAMDLEFGLEITGFETAEIDIFLSDEALDDALDEVEKPDLQRPAITVPGDVWICGVHRIICGSSLDEETLEALLKGEKAHLVVQDPPFNVKIDGHVCGTGKKKHPEFAMASGEMTSLEFTEFLTQNARLLVKNTADGSIHFVFMDWRHMGELLTAGDAVGYELKNLCVWAKDNGGMGSLYRSRHELVFVFKNGTASHTNNIQLGKHGRYRTNVWEYPGVNSFGGGRQHELDMHPTVKPYALIMDAIKDCSKRGDLVLDTFGGSGTTLIAAEKTGRRARLVEIDPRYVDVTIRRWQDLTGSEAVLSGTDLTFNDMALERQDSHGDVS